MSQSCLLCCQERRKGRRNERALGSRAVGLAGWLAGRLAGSKADRKAQRPAGRHKGRRGGRRQGKWAGARAAVKKPRWGDPWEKGKAR